MRVSTGTSRSRLTRMTANAQAYSWLRTPHPPGKDRHSPARPAGRVHKERAFRQLALAIRPSPDLWSPSAHISDAGRFQSLPPRFQDLVLGAFETSDPTQ